VLAVGLIGFIVYMIASFIRPLLGA
jgi:preprotein translocase subunit Sss1